MSRRIESRHAAIAATDRRRAHADARDASGGAKRSDLALNAVEPSDTLLDWPELIQWSLN